MEAPSNRPTSIKDEEHVEVESVLVEVRGLILDVHLTSLRLRCTTSGAAERNHATVRHPKQIFVLCSLCVCKELIGTFAGSRRPDSPSPGISPAFRFATR